MKEEKSRENTEGLKLKGLIDKRYIYD